ncbi:MAG TPA: hypothetical protein VLH79_09570 [Chthonomonadales bacterium]|nr:hypothetical protein [Chthonomonadales bacterium]
MIAPLLKTRLLMYRNTLLRGEPRERRRARSGLIVSAVIVLALGLLSYSFFEPFVLLARTDYTMQVVLVRTPAFAFFSAFWMLLISAITVGIQVLYLNPEMNLLLASPARPRAILAAKFIEATAANATLFLTIGAPLLLAYGLAHGSITQMYVVYLALILIAFCALPTCLGLLLTQVLMRSLPASRTRDFLGAAGIAVFALAYIAMSLSMRSVGDSAAIRQWSGQAAEVLTSPILLTGPWAWAGDVFAGELGAGAIWLRIGGLWALAAISIAVASAAAQRIFWPGWSAAQEAAARRPGTPAAGPSGSWERRLGLIHPPMRAVLLKDLRCLGRDIRQLSLFMIPLAVVVVILINVQQSPRMGELPAGLLALTIYPILAMISMRIAMSGLVTENRAMWLMMSAPNDPVTVLGGKLLYACALSLPVSVGATVLYAALHGGMGGAEWAGLLIHVSVATVGFCGIGVGTSAYFCDFNADGARFTISGGARIITFLLQMAYLAVLATAAALGFALTVWGVATEPAGALAGVLVAVGATAPVVAVTLSAGARRLRQLEW